MTPLLLFLLLVQDAPPPVASSLAPVSDAAREPGFPQYLKKLREAIEKQDARALRKLVDPDVITGGFGPKDERGWDKFAQRWQVEDPAGSVWSTLADLVDLGFFREAPQTLVAPYLAWKFPRELDQRTHLVVLRDALELRAGPSRNARTVGVLAFDIVKRVGPAQPGEGFEWLEIETLGGKRGWVQSTNVRSPLMARAQFGRKDGRWMLVVLDKGQL